MTIYRQPAHWGYQKEQLCDDPVNTGQKVPAGGREKGHKAGLPTSTTRTSTPTTTLIHRMRASCLF